jgi:hypothetical protein
MSDHQPPFSTAQIIKKISSKNFFNAKCAIKSDSEMKVKLQVTILLMLFSLLASVNVTVART